jgi:hypothetical protein
MNQQGKLFLEPMPVARENAVSTSSSSNEIDGSVRRGAALQTIENGLFDG